MKSCLINKKKGILCFLLFAVCCFNMQGQSLLQSIEIERRGDYFFHHRISVSPGQVYILSQDFLSTSITLKIPKNQQFNTSYIYAANDTFHIKEDEHIENMLLKNADLIIFHMPVKQLIFYSGSMNGEIDLFFLNASLKENKQKGLKKSFYPYNEDCSEPQTVDQSVWRAGLPTPSYDRIFTEVQHVIVHHSAGANDNTNYTEVVRNIYLYHTEVNGWSDIGYNYLIAQDGTIFKGRDPENGAQDDVQGAHFCGKNSSTMGVCLLGTYTEVAPTDASVEALIDLISWKLDKNQLNPLGSSVHPANNSLGTIAGHRDGCQTECPGEKTYALLGQFREATDLQTNTCHEVAPEEEENEEESESPQQDPDEKIVLKIYPNPNHTGALYIQYDEDVHGIQDAYIYDLRGIKAKIKKFYYHPEENALSFSLGSLRPGVYVVNLVGKDRIYRKKLIILYP